jgi:hypothetical protein
MLTPMSTGSGIRYPTYFPYGVATADSMLAYMGIRGSSQAIDLANGMFIWSIPLVRPLITINSTLLGLRNFPGRPAELQVVGFDEKRGSELLASAPFNALGSAFDSDNVAITAYIDGNTAVLVRRHVGRYRGGAAPPSEIEAQAKASSTSAVRVDLSTGAVNEASGSALVPRWAQDLESGEPPYPDGTFWASQPWEVDGCPIFISLRDIGNEIALELHAATKLISLLHGPAPTPRLCSNGRHLYVRGAPDAPWQIYELPGGRHVSGFDAAHDIDTVAVIGAYFFVVYTPSFVLEARDLASGAEHWHLSLARPPARPPPALRP